MLASLRTSASHPWMIASKVFERCEISVTDMPTPGNAIRSRCASASTASGRMAGPAAKLWMRSVMMPPQNLPLAPDVQVLKTVKAEGLVTAQAKLGSPESHQILAGMESAVLVEAVVARREQEPVRREAGVLVLGKVGSRPDE